MEKQWKDYFNPTSVTWWAGMSFILVGVFIASEPIHHLNNIASAVKAMTLLPPAILIQTGIGWIGIRAAIERK